jgi:glycerate kinase
VALRILLAPDKFKGTLDAPAVAAAMAEGVRDLLPGAVVTTCPLADGGEGTLDCVAAAVPGTFVEVAAEDAFGSPVTARVYDTGAAVMVAMHETARLPERPAPAASLRASSRGTGLALARARALFPEREIVVWVGGSASTDGGAGAAPAAGFRLLDARGRDLVPGGAALRRLARIVPPETRPAGPVTGACDVASPLLGPRGAARLFAPQKGAGPAEVEVLEDALATLADRIRVDLGRDVSSLAHGGAGGGMGSGLAAFFGARLEDGFARVAAATGLRRLVAAADVVVTGEGRLDRGTLQGKVIGNVARLCAEESVPCLILAGEVALPMDLLPPERALGVDGVVAVVDECGRGAAFRDPSASIRTAAARLVARRLGRGG